MWPHSICATPFTVSTKQEFTRYDSLLVTRRICQTNDDEELERLCRETMHTFHSQSREAGFTRSISRTHQSVFCESSRQSDGGKWSVRWRDTRHYVPRNKKGYCAAPAASLRACARGMHWLDWRKNGRNSLTARATFLTFVNRRGKVNVFE